MKLTRPIASLILVLSTATILGALVYASHRDTESAATRTSDKWNWTNYTNPNNVRALAWEGTYIWAGTTGGVARWNASDGSYHLFTTADGLAGNFVAHTAVDGSGQKWFDTAHGGVYGGASAGTYGVSQFDGTTWTTHSGWPPGSEPHNVTSFAIDFSGDLWAGTRGAGVYTFSGSTWNTITATVDGLASNHVLAIALGGDGHLWFATDHGISEFDEQGWTTHAYSDDAVAMAVAGEYVWVATPDGAGRLTISDDTYTVFDTHDGLISSDLKSVALDWDGRVWFGSDAGASVYYQDSWTNYTTSDGLSSGIVWAITVDGLGHVWLGTSTGLTEYDDGLWTIHTVAQAPSSNYVDALLPEGSSAFWAAAGTSQESLGLDHFDGTSWTNFGVLQGLPHGNVDAIAKDNAGHVWVGTEGGIAAYDGSLWISYTVPSLGDEIHDITLDATSGHLWFATDDGAAEYDGSLWNIYKTTDGLVSDNVTSIALDSANGVWFGTDSGVNRLLEGNWTTFTTSDGLVSNSIADIATDDVSRVWFATPSGLSVYDSGTWDTFTEADSSLVSDLVQSLAVDSWGAVWIGSSGGANRVYQDEWSTFTCLDGLADNDVHAIATDDQGLVWFGTDSGITRLNTHYYDCTVAPTTAAKSGDPGTTVNYTLQITNTGTKTDVYTVTISGNTWTTTAPETVGPLAVNADATVDVAVKVPANAAGGASDTATVAFTSRGDTTVVVAATLTTQANTVYKVTLLPAAASKSGKPGTAVVYELQVTNAGNVADKFSVSVAGNTWSTVAAPTTIGPLARGASAALQVTVDVPATAAENDVDTATIRVTSQGLSSVSDTATLTTRAGTYKLYLPIIAR